MVKYHTYTDREVRYTNRCNNKFRNETASEIKKKDEEISSLRRANVETMNKVKRTLTSYNFIYKNYSEIYESYNNLLEEYDFLRNEKTYIENKILDSNNDKIFKLEKDLNLIEENINLTRKKILDLKKNLRVFYGVSNSTL